MDTPRVTVTSVPPSPLHGSAWGFGIVEWQVTQGFNVLDVAPDEHFARTCETVVRCSRSSGEVVALSG